MTYWGEVKNGVVVFREALPLEEGTLVRVEAVAKPSNRPTPGSRDAMLECDARWAGEPEELDRLLAEVQRARDADLTPVGTSE